MYNETMWPNSAPLRYTSLQNVMVECNGTFDGNAKISKFLKNYFAQNVKKSITVTLLL